jgi:hypothetical protein
MPRHLPADLLERVVAALGQHPKGLALADLEAKFKDVASRRSLQRRLDQWVRRHAIRADGVRRGRRYFVAATASDSTVITPEPGALTISSAPPAAYTGVPVSTAGLEIQAFVRRPIADRPPVGCQREFLEDYVPNETAYLPDTLRNHLHELGRTPDGPEHMHATYSTGS